MNKRKVGFDKEEMAAQHLIENGYEIIERNFYTKFGEIDLIAKDQGCLVFLEVKYRSSTKFGYPEEAVDRNKMQKMIRCAGFYLLKNRIEEGVPSRFDVVAILGDEIKVIKNAYR